MKVLLDTQSLIWALERDELLSSKARTAILTADVVFISPINLYEIAIKLAIGRDAGVNRPIQELITSAEESGFSWLPISPEHLGAYTKLPFLDNHRDPFDRLILATALADQLVVVSSDHNFPLYNEVVTTIW